MNETKKSKEKQELEIVIEQKIKPLVDSAFHRFTGVSINELNTDISAKLTRSPLLDFKIDTKIPFKLAKRMFKQEYLKRLLERNYGNISEVAKLAKVDRRSVHRLVKEIDVGKIRKEMLKPSYVKQMHVSSIIEHTLNDYKEKKIIHPDKLEEFYKNVNIISRDIVKDLPEDPLTLKEAEEEFEHAYLKKALEENSMDTVLAAKKIKIRYETLHRKAKKLRLI